ESRWATYAVDAGILYGMLNYHLDGTLTESVDRVGGRYDVTIAGEGDGIANRIESSGVLREGRWAPSESHSFFSVRGRESRSDIAYDWARGTIEYRFRGETFFLRKLRVADDVVAVPEGLHVDDSLSATLNYADERWAQAADGSYQTHVIRRKKPDNEGLDDAQGTYRAELVPLALKIAADPPARCAGRRRRSERGGRVRAAGAPRRVDLVPAGQSVGRARPARARRSRRGLQLRPHAPERAHGALLRRVRRGAAARARPLRPPRLRLRPHDGGRDRLGAGAARAARPPDGHHAGARRGPAGARAARHARGG